MSSECMLGCALFMWLASVDVPLEPLHANKAPHGCIFPYLETSTEQRTEHFLMGGSNCRITFHTHEFLFRFPVGGATMVTVARFLFFCPHASEQRVSHTEVVDLPCPPLSAQGAEESLLWLLSVALTADPRTFTTRVSSIKRLMSFIYFCFCYNYYKAMIVLKACAERFLRNTQC